MKIVKDYRHCCVKFQIKIKDKYVTVATLRDLMFSMEKYELYFTYYGDEYNAGFWACDRFNGNVSFTIKQKPYETRAELIERVGNIVRKKVYQIADDILTDIKKTTWESIDVDGGVE